MENNVVTVEQPIVPVRDISIITGEIKVLDRQACSATLPYIIAIGKCLIEAKAVLPHGEWGNWLKNEVEYSQSTANNFMRLSEEFSNSQSIGNLSYTHALKLLAVPKEEREEFVEKVDAENLSVKELEKAIKERDEARRAAEDAERQKAELEQKNLELTRASEKANESSAEVDKLRAEIQKLEKREEKAKADLKKALDNPKVSDDVLNKIKAEAAENAKKDVSEELEKAKKALFDAVAKEKDARGAEQKARQELENAQKQLKTASPDVTTFKTIFETLQENAGKILKVLEKIRTEDSATADKLSQALNAFADQIRRS